MAAIRMLFSWFTEKGVLAMNPAREVKTERFSRTEGKTPAFVEGEVQKLLAAIETSTHTGLRDRALLGVLAYTFARIGAVVNLKVEDYYPSGKRFLLRFKEKGGKEKELPVHHKLEELLDEYLKATGLGAEPGSPLFPAALGKTGKLSRRSLVRTDAPMVVCHLSADHYGELGGRQRRALDCADWRRCGQNYKDRQAAYQYFIASLLQRGDTAA